MAHQHPDETSKLEIPSDPRKFGPGTWMALHILAFNSKTRAEHLIFCKSARLICGSLPCHTCRKHATDFIKTYPPEKVIDDSTECMFKWSCQLHNNANKMTGADLVDWKVMYNIYADNTAECDDCLVTGPTNSPPPITGPINSPPPTQIIDRPNYPVKSGITQQQKVLLDRQRVTTYQRWSDQNKVSPVYRKIINH